MLKCSMAAFRLAVVCMLCCGSMVLAGDTVPHPDVKTMAVRVVGEVGKPLPYATVHVGILDFHGKEMVEYSTPDLSTDDEGMAVASYTNPMNVRRDYLREESLIDGRTMYTLKISVSVKGYVPMHMSFRAHDLNLDTEIPESFEFQLHKGQKLSGRVLDRKGKSIEGARVQVDVDVPSYPGIKPQATYGPFAVGESSVLTDSNGHWEVTNAPGPEAYSGKFKLKVNHPEYVGDKEWGDVQKTQRVSTEQLRNGTAIFRLGKGLNFFGKVTDTQGNLIAKGMVNWKNPAVVHDWDSSNVEIDSTGQFDTGRLDSGSYRFTVCSPGYCPQQHEVEITDESQQMDIRLQKGRVVKLRIVDLDGNPIPHVSVVVWKWHGTQCLYEYNRDPKGSRSPRKGLATVLRPNKDNLFVWDSAPEDEVEYQISAEWFVCPNIMIAATPYVFEKRLRPMAAFFGTVTDQVTGEPIKEFDLLQVESKFDEPESNKVIYRKHFFEPSGNYRCLIWNGGNNAQQVRVRIEADGYLPGIGTTNVGLKDMPLQQDFALKAGDSFAARLREQYRPIGEFEVSVGSDGRVVDYYQLIVATGKYSKAPITFKGRKNDNSEVKNAEELVDILVVEGSDHVDASDVVGSDGRLNVTSEIGIRAKAFMEESLKIGSLSISKF